MIIYRKTNDFINMGMIYQWRCSHKDEAIHRDDLSSAVSMASDKDRFKADSKEGNVILQM